MATKYIHARLQPRAHPLIPAGDSKIDQRFGEEEFLEGLAQSALRP